MSSSFFPPRVCVIGYFSLCERVFQSIAMLFHFLFPIYSFFLYFTSPFAAPLTSFRLFFPHALFLFFYFCSRLLSSVIDYFYVSTFTNSFLSFSSLSSLSLLRFVIPFPLFRYHLSFFLPFSALFSLSNPPIIFPLFPLFYIFFFSSTSSFSYSFPYLSSITISLQSSHYFSSLSFHYFTSFSSLSLPLFLIPFLLSLSLSAITISLTFFFFFPSFYYPLSLCISLSFFPFLHFFSFSLIFLSFSF